MIKLCHALVIFGNSSSICCLSRSYQSWCLVPPPLTLIQYHVFVVCGLVLAPSVVYNHIAKHYIVLNYGRRFNLVFKILSILATDPNMRKLLGTTRLLLFVGASGVLAVNDSHATVKLNRVALRGVEGAVVFQVLAHGLAARCHSQLAWLFHLAIVSQDCRLNPQTSFGGTFAVPSVVTGTASVLGTSNGRTLAIASDRNWLKKIEVIVDIWPLLFVKIDWSHSRSS